MATTKAVASPFTQAEDTALRRRNPSAGLGPGFSGDTQFPLSP